MKIIFISNRKGTTRSLTLNNWARVLLSMCMLGLPVTGGILIGSLLTSNALPIDLSLIESMRQELELQQAELDSGREDARQKVEALTLKLAELQARLVRLDALGERLSEVSGLEDGEFDFSQQPAVGGPEQDAQQSYQYAELEDLFQQLEAQLDSRESQLGILESLMMDRNVQRQSAVTGRPVKKGWMSSGFGRRTDPFTGHRAWHNGVDFAGKLGSEVVAVAAGVVTWSGERNGYGQMVELDHGEGHVTRYAHNSENRVKVGDLVKKGEVIALMGSSGRSTGPHVHFEVYKNGRAVDPASYIRRTIR
ncbi:MAG: peptidoglycan DD-metalloendopeptidase family protein [Porticoccaceae bacterium]